MKIKSILLVIMALWGGILTLYSQNEEKLITVKGTVTDNTGKRVEGAFVYGLSSHSFVQNGNLELTDKNRTNRRGQFSIKVFENDTLYISTKNHALVSVPVDGRTKIEITLIKNEPVKIIIVSGSVKDENGKPLEGIFIGARLEGTEKETPITMTLSSGFFNVQVPVESKLVFYNQDYEIQEVPVEEGKDVNVIMKKK